MKCAQAAHVAEIDSCVTAAASMLTCLHLLLLHSSARGHTSLSLPNKHTLQLLQIAAKLSAVPPAVSNTTKLRLKVAEKVVVSSIHFACRS